MSAQIPTALTGAETHQLSRLAENKRVLEIGSLLGYSTVELAAVAAQVVSVDPHEGYPEDAPRSTLGPFLENLESFGVRDRVVVMLGFDWQVLPVLRSGWFDLIFIDMTGDYETTLTAMRSAKPLLACDGVLAVHDCGHPEWPGALQAVEEFASLNRLEYELTDRLAVFRGL